MLAKIASAVLHTGSSNIECKANQIQKLSYFSSRLTVVFGPLALGVKLKIQMYFKEHRQAMPQLQLSD